MSENEQDKRLEETAGEEPAKEEKSGREAYEWVQALVCSVLAVVVLFTFVIRLIGVDGYSMVPTLQDGDRLLVTTSLLSGEYRYGDIVIIQKGTFADGDPIVKRVIHTTADFDYAESLVFSPGVAPAFFMAQAMPANLAPSYASFTASSVSTRPVESSAIWPFGSTCPGRMAFM